ncbi:FliI/YscN family ATPase [Pseudokineococcus basanitobsidens]|uniref:FliI/YscN family ATPase n=1 Tax=Pseudokineococcus basanitobsidens TaxID=1926649 RepID=UPI003BB7AA4B
MPAGAGALRDLLADAVRAAAPRELGSVRSVSGLAVDVVGLVAGVGEVLEIGPEGAGVRAEVVGVRAGVLACMPLGTADGLAAGDPVRRVARRLTARVGEGLLGRVLDGLGRPLDGRPLPAGLVEVPLDAPPPPALDRRRVSEPLPLGVRALDTLVPAGRGQRFGLFAGSGVGKSSLLSMVARGTHADVVVLALVGERGREVREFLEDDLGPEGLARSVVVVATSDEPPLVRLRAAATATAVAEHFRDQGLSVVLMMDSLTRVATAQREIGLSVGEPPATRGFPPSVFAMLPRLLERAGPGVVGSITGIYTVLVDGDDHDEPVADAARSILDGHVVLDRRLATAGHFPSIDVLGSVSRVATRVTTPQQRADATTVRRALAARRDAQDLVDVGAYVPGADPLVDAALAAAPSTRAFLTQAVDDVADVATSWAALSGLARMLDPDTTAAPAGPGAA